MRSKFLTSYLFVIFLSLLFTNHVFAQNGEPKFSARVSLGIQGDQRSLSIVKSYLTKELRSIPDVVVTDDDPGWRIMVLMVQDETKGGKSLGYTFSIVILRNFWSDYFYYVKELSPSLKKEFKELTSPLYYFETTLIRTGAPEDLQFIWGCKRETSECPIPSHQWTIPMSH